LKARIKICKEYPAYWEYAGKPILLLGGSVEDNLFQLPNLKEHLSLLKSVGGNYVRCTMSSRDPGNIWPYEKSGERYDLNKPSQAFWERFSNFLKLTYALDVVLQIEVWDRFDFSGGPWQGNPFNPQNNINYTEQESKLKEKINTHPGKNENRFFFTIPEAENNEIVLSFQKQFVDQMLFYALEYPNVLYCMDNETGGLEEWGKYWSTYIKAKAAQKNLEVQTTEMWDDWDLSHDTHRRTFDHPEIYSFCDVSQNNHQNGQTHWDNAQRVRKQIVNPVRPLNNVKIYGSNTSPFGNEVDGMERFWRNVFGKMASARFHRPTSGLGLSEKACANIKSMRLLTDAMDIFTCEPHNDLLSKREKNEAYCLANPEKEMAVFFCRKGEVWLDTSKMKGDIIVRWLNIFDSKWQKDEIISQTEKLKLQAPITGMQAVLVKLKG